MQNEMCIQPVKLGKNIFVVCTLVIDNSTFSNHYDHRQNTTWCSLSMLTGHQKM